MKSETSLQRLRSLTGVVTCLLLTSVLSAAGQHTTRKLRQTEQASSQDATVQWGDELPARGGHRTFLALKDPRNAASQDVQRLYEQGASASSIAYLLFAAAEPLSEAEGSSNALLPYLTPTILRLYVSRPGRCGSPLAEELYELSQSMYGSVTLQACHYALYRSLQSTFAWVRDNIVLALQQLPDQPLAAAAWPDSALYPDLELAAAVLAALSDADKLGATSELLEGSCGLNATDFAALVPRISEALRRLHADLPMLQDIAATLHNSHWEGESGASGHSHSGEHRRAALEAEELGNPNGSDPDVLSVSVSEDASAASRLHHLALSRRQTLSLPSNLNYSLPPSNFVLAGAATLPQLLLPLTFHIMMYKDTTGAVAPSNYDQALSYVQRMVRVANYMAKPAKVQFFIKEVRNNATLYPDLLLPNRTTWLKAPDSACTGPYCFTSSTYMSKLVADWPRTINVFVTSDSTSGVPLGYAYVPGSDLYPEFGHVFITWDSLSIDGSNTLKSYNDGPNTLLHEVFHHLGLQHPFGPSNAAATTCTDGDYVLDTPATLGPATSSSFYSTAQAYCMELFWGTYSGDWDAAYSRWSSNLGVPETDMNTWADSCPALAGYDELGNYMTYNTPVCYAALGHFTAGQVERVHFLTSEMNPVLYAWGQYYAQNAAPPPPQSSPPPEYYTNICKATKNNCACKSSWTYNSTTYAYCDRTGSSNSLTCEVADAASCADCTSSGACILSCTGTAKQCKKSLVPGTATPPPPPPRPPSPPPNPPPPPPRSVPSACQKTSGGCDCRSTWQYGTKYYSYCASPDNDTRLWCQVSATCASFNNSNPYQYCASSLNTSYCGGEVYFSTLRTPPLPPPSLSPRPPPSPPSVSSPPPPPAVVAEVKGRVTLGASCNVLNSASDKQAFTDSLIQELARVFAVASSYIRMNSLICGSVVADYTVSFPTGATATQVLAVNTAAGSLVGQVSTSYGNATNATALGVTVVQASQLCPQGAAVSVVCPGSPTPAPRPPSPQPPTPPPSSNKRKTLRIIILAVIIAVVLAIIVAIIVVCVIRNRNKQRDGRVAPEPGSTQVVAVAVPPMPQGTQPIAGAYGGYGTAPGGYYAQQQYPQPYQPQPQQYPQAQPGYYPAVPA